jgi:hypothetical protein
VYFFARFAGALPAYSALAHLSGQPVDQCFNSPHFIGIGECLEIRFRQRGRETGALPGTAAIFCFI